MSTHTSVSGQNRNLHPGDRHVLFRADLDQIVTVAEGMRGHIVRVTLALFGGLHTRRAYVFRIDEPGPCAGDAVEAHFREQIGVRDLQFDSRLPGR